MSESAPAAVEANELSTGAADAGSGIETVDVVLCLQARRREALDCLAALNAWTLQDHRLIVMCDGAGWWLRRALRRSVRDRAGLLIEHSKKLGPAASFSAAVQASSADALVFVDSGVRVSPGWLRELVRAANEDGLRAVAPVSQTTAWAQEKTQEKARFLGAHQETVTSTPIDVPMADSGVLLVARELLRDGAPLRNGGALKTVPGTLVGLSLRLASNGGRVALAPKSRVDRVAAAQSRRDLASDLATLGTNLGTEKLAQAQEQLRSSLDALRADENDVRRTKSNPAAWGQQLQDGVVFLLPVNGGGGGVHSIVQEAAGMRAAGVPCRVAVPAGALGNFHDNYPQMPRSLFQGYHWQRDLVELLAHPGWVVGTLFTSMKLLKRLRPKLKKNLGIGYYVQDYEPWIVPEDSAYYREALASYTQVSDCVLFAKTQWLCRKVEAEHGVSVHQVRPSIDTELFRQAPQKQPRSRLTIAAMVRPKTPRRNALGTVQALEAVVESRGEAVDIVVFGCTDSELAELTSNPRLKNRGVLKREEVAEILQTSDIFVDFSVYQAFGRTAMEAMACGCAVVVPANGGAPEFGQHEATALVADTDQVSDCTSQLDRLIDDAELRQRISLSGFELAQTYTVASAVESELRVLEQAGSKEN